jgi:hypothetical protein
MAEKSISGQSHRLRAHRQRWKRGQCKPPGSAIPIAGASVWRLERWCAELVRSMRDIYTLKPILVSSEEHVIQDALGGRLESGELIDKSTNDLFGSTIDADLVNGLQIVRVLLDAKSGDGRSPPAIRGLASDDGNEYDLLAGGHAELGKQKIAIEQVDGEVLMHVNVRDKQEIRKLARRALERRGVSAERLEQSLEKIESTRRPAPPLQVPTTWGRGFWRAIAKNACNLLAHKACAIFLETGFNPVRQFVLAGGDPWEFVAMHCTPLNVGTALGPLDHLIVVRGTAETGQVAALVVLYGHVEFVVRLGKTALTSDLATAYRVDQLGSTHRLDDDRDLAIHVPEFVRLTEATQRDWFAANEVAMNRVLGTVQAIVDKRAFDHLSQLLMGEIFAGGGTYSQSDINAAAVRLIGEHYPGLLRRP